MIVASNSTPLASVTGSSGVTGAVLDPTATASLASILASRRWWLHREPFTYLVARDVFTAPFYQTLVAAFQERLERGLSSVSDPDRFSRNMPNSDAYAWNFPPDLDGSLAVFYSRAWHELLVALTGVAASGDVNGALHHHHPGSRDGRVHRDLGVGWFSTQPRPDGINPMDLRRCSYTHGQTFEPGVHPREMVRAVTMIFYLANPSWSLGDGGETGLYQSADDPVDQPAAVTPPIDNSLVIFENTPASYHSFLRNRRGTRNSLILWLHRSRAEAAARWGEGAILTW